ncbi:CYTH and CHAD domain-containing protein [Zavarzinia sp. CC-PAN008]|uniref:CYTH and CHAD domain-containing protein n=1 Tax=Zavarzinia sp. CC-PAN008 TaxID=3243332 RepID=UPI003F748914
MAHETELKLEYPAQALRRVEKSQPLKDFGVGRARIRELVSTYYDLPDRSLGAAGLSIRLRRIGEQAVMTVKAPGTDQGPLAHRLEWEIPAPAGELALDAYPPGTIDQVLDVARVAPALVPLFSTHITRRERRVLMGETTILLLAFDEGEVRAGDAHDKVSELEIELVQGEPAAIFDLALALHAVEPTRIGTLTKAARGHALLEGTRAAPVKAAEIALDPVSTTGDALAAIVANCLEQWLANQAGVLAGDDPEAVHQMRVALRRLRSALRLFRTVLDGATTDPLDGELRWAASALGQQRDWDVFVDEILASVRDGLPDEDVLALLAERAAAPRAAGRAAAQAAIASPRHAEAALRVGRWLAARAWSAPDSGSGPEAGAAPDGRAAALAAPAAVFAAGVLEKRYRRVRKAGRHIETLPAESLHALRIQIKRLRYGIEFFSSLFSQKAVRRFGAALQELQSLLGHLNDIEVAKRHLATLDDGRPSTARAAGLVLGFHGGQVAAERRALFKAWARLKDLAPFWHDA